MADLRPDQYDVMLPRPSACANPDCGDVLPRWRLIEGHDHALRCEPCHAAYVEEQREPEDLRAFDCPRVPR